MFNEENDSILLKRNVEKLGEFLPYLYELADKPIEAGVKDMLPYYVYEDKFLELLGIVYREIPVLNYLEIEKRYSLTNLDQKLAALESADMELTMALLTGITRQERFNTGLWAKGIKRKFFIKAIERLLELIIKD